MKKTYLLFISLILFFSTLFAVDYSEMSTQELIAIMGYVKPENQKKFDYELKSRVDTMGKKEKIQYKENLKKLQEKK